MEWQAKKQSQKLGHPRFRMLGTRMDGALRNLAVTVLLATILIFPLQASAFDISYGGRLSGPSGEPLAGPVDLTFRFYREASGGSVLLSVAVPSVPLVDGVFQTDLPIPSDHAEQLFEHGDKTVFIEVESQGKIYPRQKFSYVPLALRVPVDGSKIVYDSQGRLTLATGSSTGTLNGVSGTGGVEKTGDQSYGTFVLSPVGKSLIGAASTAAQRTLLGLGTMAERNAITPSDISSSDCAEGTVLRRGSSSWGCQTLNPSLLGGLVSQTEFDYLDGVTSPIQTQLNSRLSSSGGTVTGPLTLAQGSELRLATTNAGVSAGFKAPSNMATSTIYTLPSGFATTGQVLTSSSNGVLSWTNIPVTTVNGQTGNVLIDADNINETSARKYYSHSLARQALSSTGLLSYNSTTGVLSLSDTLLTKSGGTMTGSLDFGGTLKVTNLADPTVDGDAAKKGYVDSKLGGQPLVVGTPSPGQVVKWDGSKFALASDELGQAGGGIASLNTLTTGSQSLTVDIPGVSAGTRPNWTAESATSTHRLTIPMASASGVTAGLISKTEYDVFSGKQDTITQSSTIALGAVATNLQNALDLRPYGTSAAQTGELRFRELAASGTNYLGLKSPDNLFTNTIWTLPSGDGASGFVLSTDGSGTLSWISPTTGSVTSIATGTGLAGGPITGSGTISLANVGTAGTYSKVTTNAQGQVISGASLADTDIPNLSATKITSGTLAVAQGGTGSATAQPFFVLAGPGVGPTAGAPSFRALSAADIPNLDAAKITSGTLSNSLINWAAAPVTTVSGRTGAVTLSSTDISGLSSLATANAVSGGSGGTIADDSITNADINSAAAIADTKLDTIATAGKVANSATTATSAGTANAIVARDASGNFTAGTISATLNGNATNVTGTVALANGGTGATTAASARTNLGAAASGANTDITSLTNLTSLTTTGNVGIGSGTPGFRLDVATSGAGLQTVERLQNTITAANNSGAQTMYSANRTTNGLTDVAAIGGTITDISASAYKGALVFSTANNAAPAERMRIDSNGNVGIGTLMPTNALEVAGKIKSNSGGIVFPDGTTQTTAVAMTSFPPVVAYAAGSWNTLITNVFYRPSSFTTTGSAWNRALTDTGGYFNTSTGVFTAPASGIYLVSLQANGIGAGTSVGQRILFGDLIDGVWSEIYDRATASCVGCDDSVITYVVRLNTNQTHRFARHNAGVTPGDAIVSYVYLGAALSGGADDMGNHIATKNIRLNSYYLSGDGDSEGISINSVGNVGIGTSAPSHRLHVNSGSNSSLDGINLTAPSGSYLAMMPNISASAYTGITQSGDAALIFSSGTQNGGGLTIAPWNTSNGGLRMNGSGNVGIGITNPSYTLHVVGSAGLSSGTAWTNASDIRLKDIDGDYEYGLDEIKRLHTVRFHYKKDNPLELPSDHAMTGFIAQEVQEVIPDAVKSGAKGYLELNVDPIHWATVNAVKELADQNAQLKQRVDKAEERADRAEAETAEIKRAICAKIPDLSICGH